MCMLSAIGRRELNHYEQKNLRSDWKTVWLPALLKLKRITCHRQPFLRSIVIPRREFAIVPGDAQLPIVLLQAAGVVLPMMSQMLPILEGLELISMLLMMNGASYCNVGHCVGVERV
jgi:hypothetical protein